MRQDEEEGVEEGDLRHVAAALREKYLKPFLARSHVMLLKQQLPEGYSKFKNEMSPTAKSP